TWTGLVWTPTSACRICRTIRALNGGAIARPTISIVGTEEVAFAMHNETATMVPNLTLVNPTTCARNQGELGTSMRQVVRQCHAPVLERTEILPLNSMAAAACWSASP